MLIPVQQGTAKSKKDFIVDIAESGRVSFDSSSLADSLLPFICSALCPKRGGTMAKRKVPPKPGQTRRGLATYNELRRRLSRVQLLRPAFEAAIEINQLEVVSRQAAA